MAAVSRQLPEDEAIFHVRDQQIGKAAGHEYQPKFLGEHDWAECGCGKFKSNPVYDDMTPGFEAWKRHAQHAGVSFGGLKHVSHVKPAIKQRGRRKT